MSSNKRDNPALCRAICGYRPSVIAAAARELYGYAKAVFARRGVELIIAGSCATAQALANESGLATDIGDIDMFVADTTLTMEDIEGIVTNFQEESKYCFTVTPEDDMPRASNWYGHLNITITANIQIHDSPSKDRRTGPPIHLIGVDLTHLSGSLLEREVMSASDVSVCRVVIPDPHNASFVRYLDRHVLDDVRNGTMGYDVRCVRYQDDTTELRFEKYISRGWILNKLQLGDHTWLLFENARWNDSRYCFGQDGRRFNSLYDTVRSQPQWFACVHQRTDDTTIIAPSSVNRTAESDSNTLRRSPNSVIHPLIRQLYEFLTDIFEKREKRVVLAGSSALAQKITNETGSAAEFNDVDLFIQDVDVTFHDILRLLGDFESTTGCSALVSNPSLTSPDNQLYEHTKISMIANVSLFEDKVGGRKITTPVQLIGLDLSYGRDNDLPMQSFEEEVFDKFDISVCKCAILNPRRMTVVHCRREDHNDIMSMKMEYNLRWLKNGKVAGRRIQKYMNRGWRLDRLRFGRHGVLWVDNAALHDKLFPRRQNYASFLTGVLKRDADWAADNERKLHRNRTAQLCDGS